MLLSAQWIFQSLFLFFFVPSQPSFKWHNWVHSRFSFQVSQKKELHEQSFICDILLQSGWQKSIHKKNVASDRLKMSTKNLPFYFQPSRFMIFLAKFYLMGVEFTYKNL